MFTINDQQFHGIGHTVDQTGQNQQIYLSARESVDSGTGEVLSTCDCDHNRKVRLAGLDYIKQGIRVLPLYGVVLGQDGEWHCECGGSGCETEARKRAGKHPRWRANRQREGGAWAATRSPETWTEWCREFPNLNLGVATGVTPGDDIGILGVDIDGASGWEQLEGKELPPTRTHQTGRPGGQHRLHTVTGPVGSQTDMKDVDMRGNGGYARWTSVPPWNRRYLSGCRRRASGTRCRLDASDVRYSRPEHEETS